MEFRNKLGKPIGEFKDGVFTKHAQKSKHWVRIYDGWGFDDSVVEKLKQMGCETVVVYDKERYTHYSVPFRVLDEEGIRHDLGHGLQVFLSKRWWDIKNVKGEILQNRDKTESEIMFALL